MIIETDKVCYNLICTNVPQNKQKITINFVYFADCIYSTIVL